MDDGTSSPFAIDYDYMDELLLEGCWLETTEGSEFLSQSPSNSRSLFDRSFGWPELETIGDLSTTRPLNNDQIERKNTANTLPVCQNMSIDVPGCFSQSENYEVEGSELGRRLWIGPRSHPGATSSVVERLIKAIECVKEFARDKDVLVQVWVPINEGGRRVLTTLNLPFSLNSSCINLAKYRDISVKYQFSAEEDSKDVVGLPGRVFLGRIPEWTPDVRLFRSDEYPRVNYAQQCDVRGTLALPVFEIGSRTCLGVIEVVMTTQQIKYRPELDNICKALEAVDLRSSYILNIPNTKAHNMSYEAILPEIWELLRFACETHKLPLAQTWVSCVQQGREGCRHSDGNYNHCVSTADQACYVNIPHFQGFHEACSEHHLLKGQGVAGEAFMTNEPCFSSDITLCGNTEYPLSHHAMMFGLHAAVAIRLRSIHTSKTDLVLEFFLPVDSRDPEEQKDTLTSLSTIIQQYCKSLRVITAKELREESAFPSHEVRVPSDERPSRQIMSKDHYCHLEGNLPEIEQHSTVLSLPDNKPGEAFGEKSSGSGQNQNDSDVKVVAGCGEEVSTFGEGTLSTMGTGRKREKRSSKAEETITLQVLRQYFAGSLKDAAKSLGVCPTTLKRICRQHGIKRWPSRKIKKVGHSLQKLQLVIDSVHGASSACQISSLFTDFAELASPNLGDFQKTSTILCEGGNINSKASAVKSPCSSCTQSSSSSQCCSSRAQYEDPMVAENSGDRELKRVKSEEELHISSKKESNSLRKSQSHKSLSENPGESLVYLSKSSGMISKQDDVQRVKVTYGDVKIRFRINNSWGFDDLAKEIARRFNISDMSKYDLKYLDDDSEWVLLTCDADLGECIDVNKSSHSQTIKLCLQVSRHHARNSLGSS